MTEQAERCRLLTATFAQGNSMRFAKMIGMSYTRWNNYECGVPLSIKALVHLHDAIPGISTDWLLFGKTDCLAPDLRKRLGAKRKRKAART